VGKGIAVGVGNGVGAAEGAADCAVSEMPTFWRTSDWYEQPLQMINTVKVIVNISLFMRLFYDNLDEIYVNNRMKFCLPDRKKLIESVLQSIFFCRVNGW